MNKISRSYKYNCRVCHIRTRCIEEKGFGPGLKTSVSARFEKRTDTFETWDMLQENCLRLQYERQEAAKKPSTATGLSKRLRQARQPKIDIQAAPPAFSELHHRPTAPVDPWVMPSPPAPAPGAAASREASARKPPCGLTMAATQRTVRLPEYGEIVLGRFEHGVSSPPDVDLAQDDGMIPSVSRRHALVTAQSGTHWIEDMGSSNGTYVNGNPVPLGSRAELTEGDRILVGRCRMAYSPLPDWVSNPDGQTSHEAFIRVTNTGDRIPLPNKSEITIGRPDHMLGFLPDIDLGRVGDISIYVSRRHVRLIRRGGLHYLEEIGSAGGTRLNGKVVQMGGSPELLRHGDQLWLGGCVLAYEWELT
jgi:pSer/pThr/pTyr-binding forkhead associated (FHA) protein